MMPPAPQPQPLPQPSAPTATLSIHVTGSHSLRTTCVIFEAEGMRGALSARVEIMLDEQSQKQPTLSPAPALPAPAEAPAAPPAISPSVWSTASAAPAASPAAPPRPRMSARLRETRFARALRLAALPVAALIATAGTQPEHAAKAFEAAALAADVDAMDRAMLDGIRARVGPDDDLWILGDFGHATATRLPAIRAIFDAIPGRKHLIRGNHDTKHCLSLPWTSVHDMHMITLDEGHFFLCHYPMRTWPSAYHRVIHLFGHVHNAWAGCRRSVNLGVEWWNYAPASPAEILDRAASLPELPPWSGAQGAAAGSAS